MSDSKPHSELVRRVTKALHEASYANTEDGLTALGELVEQLEALREASGTARGWLYHGLNGGGMKSARKAFDVLDAEFHGKASSPASEPKEGE